MILLFKLKDMIYFEQKRILEQENMTLNDEENLNSMLKTFKH